jgi:hypothetical protein
MCLYFLLQAKQSPDICHKNNFKEDILIRVQLPFTSESSHRLTICARALSFSIICTVTNAKVIVDQVMRFSTAPLLPSKNIVAIRCESDDIAIRVLEYTAKFKVLDKICLFRQSLVAYSKPCFSLRNLLSKF